MANDLEELKQVSGYYTHSQLTGPNRDSSLGQYEAALSVFILGFVKRESVVVYQYIFNNTILTLTEI